MFLRCDTIPTQTDAKINMLGVSWAVIQNFRELTQRVAVDLDSAAAYRKPPISNIAPECTKWHTKDVCEQLIKPITRRLCS